MKKVCQVIYLLLFTSVMMAGCVNFDATIGVMNPQPTVEQVQTAVIPVLEAPLEQLDDAFTGFINQMDDNAAVGLADFNAALMEEPKPFILDVRNMNEAEGKGYIQGAVLIPLRELARNTDKLPSFDTPILAYCASGWRCTIAVTALGAMGWHNVKCLKEGSYGGWLAAGFPVVEGAPEQPKVLNISEPDPAIVSSIDTMLQTLTQDLGKISAPELAQALENTPELTLLDVRSEAEVKAEGSIKALKVIHMPLAELVENRESWQWNVDTPIVIYSGDGHQSIIAATILWTYGYTQVSSLVGGYAGWVGEGFSKE